MKSPDNLDLNSLLKEMPVKAPKGYHYEVTDFKRNVAAFWLCGGPKYLYNGWKTARTIHSFYNYKKKLWYSPINSKKVGGEVAVEKIRPYSSMPITYKGLDVFFYQ